MHCYPNNIVAFLKQGFVCAITQGSIFAYLAAAKKHFALLFRCIFYREKRSACMRTVTEWLFAASATGTPEISFLRFNIDTVGGSLSNNRICHNFISILIQNTHVIV